MVPQCTFIAHNGTSRARPCTDDATCGTYCRRHYTYVERRNQRSPAAPEPPEIPETPETPETPYPSDQEELNATAHALMHLAMGRGGGEGIRRSSDPFTFIINENGTMNVPSTSNPMSEQNNMIRRQRVFLTDLIVNSLNQLFSLRGPGDNVANDFRSFSNYYLRTHNINLVTFETEQLPPVPDLMTLLREFMMGGGPPPPPTLSVEDFSKLEISESENGNCTVCLSSKENKECRKLPCNHTFHEECAKNWLVNNNASCPECRTSLVT